VIFVPTLVRRALRAWFRTEPDSDSDVAASSEVRALLADPAYEVVPGAAADQAVGALPAGALVTVTCSPRGQIPATLELAGELAAAGYRVVPHLAARLVADRHMLDRIAAHLLRHRIDEVFVIAGDAADAAGPYSGTMDLLGDLLPAAPHLRRVGVAGYPDGHPLLSAPELRSQMLAKQDLLASAGVTGCVSTQMCFDPPRIRSWLEAERAAGITLPIRLGVPGVVDRMRLIRMGTRLGVGASLRFASKQGGAIARLIAPGGYDPLLVVDALAADAGELGIEGVHLFTFNSVVETVAWRDAVLR
jgi:methylenetetrahydrofolate reductase (NADPH)